MENCTWNIKEIKEKLKYVKERLKKETNTKEREVLIYSLLTYVNLLHNTDIKRLKFTKLIDKITRGKFSLVRNRKYKKISDIAFDFKDYVYDDELLLKLSKNVATNHSAENEEHLATVKLSPQELIEISRDFYKWLGDKELYQSACKMLNNKEHLQFMNLNYQENDFGIASGVTYYDPLFEDTYIGISQEFTIFDAQVLNHEVMHSIDFRMLKKLPTNNYYGFHEIPTYTIDYLFFDYLEEKGYDLNEINKLKRRKTEYLKSLASYSLLKLKLSNSNNFLLENKIDNHLKQSISVDIRKNLLEVQSELVAKCLYTQVKENKELGIANLKKFMQTRIPINQIPDFSYINMSNQDLINTSKQFGNEANIIQKHI